MSDPLNPTDADGGLTGADTADWPKPEWQEQKSALKWPMIVLFGIPLVILACGMLLMVISYRLTQKPPTLAKPAATAVAAMPVQPADKDAQIAQLQTQVLTLQNQLTHPTDAVAPTQPLYAADPAALSQLSARLDRVETNQRILAKAAASAFAARTLQLSAKTQQPFLSELAVVEAGLDDPSLVAALRPYAEKGVPSEVTLAVAFPAAAAKANIAAKASGSEDSLIDKIKHALGGFISVRRTDNPNGQGTEAILQRAEIRLNSGDLKGAVAYLNTLSAPAQTALGPWLEQARARVLVDDTTRRISEIALNRLSQMTSEPLANGGALIRTFLILLGITILLAFAIAGMGDAGHASLNWLNYRVDTSGAAAVVIIGVLAFCAVSFWNIALWLSRSPQRAERKRAAVRRKQGDETLTRGFLNVASGDGNEARRQAAKALDVCDNVVLVRILSAMAAEQSGDDVATQAAYSAMLSIPELKLAGLKGLMRLAKSQGEKTEAVRLAGEAYAQPKPSMWAFETLFEAHLEAGEWTEALNLIDGALNRKLISPLFSERAKASLMAASAARQEAAEDAQMRDQALDYAQRAAKLQPAFTPAAIIAARLLCKAKKLGRAEDVLEAAWAASPHPAIWLTYRDLISDETPRERARRLQGLIDRNPKHRESRMLQLERALLNASKSDINAAVTALADDAADDKVTKRITGLMSRAAQAIGDLDGARNWVAHAALAKGEPEWSDIDAEGNAFAYSASDWSDLILTYAQTANLAHPRYERSEKGLPEVPELPSRYVPSMPFIKAAQRRTSQASLPDDPGGFDAAITGQDLDLIEAIPAKPVRARKVAAPKAKK